MPYPFGGRSSICTPIPITIIIETYQHHGCVNQNNHRNEDRSHMRRKDLTE